jgi:hypothetical protein
MAVVYLDARPHRALRDFFLSHAARGLFHHNAHV